MKNVFLITVEIKSAAWDYEAGSEIIIPVSSNTAYNAQSKFSNRYCGSEFPDYKIKSIVKCDTFLFRPMLAV